MTFKELLILSKRVLNKKFIPRLLPNSIPASAVAVFILTVSHCNGQSYGLSVSYCGSEIATIENEKTLEEATELMKKSSLEDSGEKISSVPATEYKLKVVGEEVCDSANEVKNKIIAQSKNEFAYAGGIYSGSDLVAVLDSFDTANDLIQSVLEDAKLGDENAKTSFLEEVKVVSGLYPMYEIKKVEEVKNIIKNGIYSYSEYEVKDGETLGIIAEHFNTSVDKLIELNNLENDNIKSGDKLSIEMLKFPINIKTERFEETQTVLPYQTVRKPDKSQLEGDEKKTIEGKDGLHTKGEIVSYLNGKEVTRNEVFSNKVDAIDECILYGTKKPTKNKNTEISSSKEGSLVWPVPSATTVTSKFGVMDGSFRTKPHTGIDISGYNVTGKDIVASTDGKVTFAGTGTGYGNFVQISGNNGICTLYAHCEKLFVKSGQEVKAGERIASVGNTGHSTGAHLHFEVIVKGTRQDPLKFFSSKK